MFDIWLDADARVDPPRSPDRDLHFYAFRGRAEPAGEAFLEGEQGLLLPSCVLTVVAETSCPMIAFLIDPTAPVTKCGDYWKPPEDPAPHHLADVEGMDACYRTCGDKVGNEKGQCVCSVVRGLNATLLRTRLRDFRAGHRRMHNLRCC
jgi:hypothetical protein